MPTVTLLDEIDDLERRLTGRSAAVSTANRPGDSRCVAADDEDEEDLYGDDDLGFDEVDEDETEDDELGEGLDEEPEEALDV